MRTSVSWATCALLILAVGVASGNNGDDCGKINLTYRPGVVDLFPGDPIYDEFVPQLETYFGVAGFDWCWTQPVVGTIGGVGIRGIWVSCGGFDLALLAPLFPQITGNVGAGPDLYGNPGIIHTAKGDIFTMSFGLSVYPPPDYDWVAFGGVSWYGDGTGEFAGASGWATDIPKTSPPTFWIRSVGSICFPD